ncbi:hypothetical protein DO021_21485 [Desulfobacter hydrogenophilus]|uniref:Mor transcription activator domain-containing protein n=1 Tax=Desulfobacter hydrogenophilus TaxID=2291 RepID=A0A328F624_9BACT|nr:Mor transcription activator family protein [Desulfobacter hydrogenophilus]QBH14307.1 hypothetical protein EYB58_16120 [Desulfobacter hydrogenophilus]RAL99970.1 hypothetical protein DO021_21485 [Desulfobacter hydrogenophilus]
MTNSRAKISMEDLSEDLRQVAEVIGLDLVARLVARVGGERVYIPSPGRLGAKARNRAIRNEFTGENHKAKVSCKFIEFFAMQPCVAGF